MNRKEFLSCACGAGLVSAASLSAADAAPAEDWRLRFTQARYAELLRVLSQRLDEKSVSEILQGMGSRCAGLWDQVRLHRGDLDGFCKVLKQSASGDEVVGDPEKGVLTVSSPERTDCFCPLSSVRQKTPALVCDCSLGWQKQAWETVLQKKVQVTLKESVLRGGKRCVFEIRVSDTPA